MLWQLNAEDARANPVDEQFGNGVHVISENDDLTGHLNWRTSGNNAQYNNHQNITYEWDKNENLKKRIDLNQSSLTEEFFYDALDRLDYSTLNGVTNLDVTLSAAGNITYKSDVGSFDYTTAQSGCSYYTHTQPHAVRNAGGVIYCYDANGNMVKRNGATTTWYSYNLPNSISNGTDGSQFFYTPDRNRWKQLASYGGVAEDTLYIGGLMEKVLPGSGGTIYRHYIPAGSNTIVYTRRSTGTHSTYYATSDHLGSSSVVTDQTGAVIVKESFGAYGKRRGTNWTGSPSSGDLTAIAGTTRHGFTGHEHIDNLGLVNMNGRVFDPVIGRFMSADPYIDWGAGSQGLNRYSYVANNPLSFIDPTGFCRSGVYYEDGAETIEACPDPWWTPWIPNFDNWAPPSIPTYWIPGGYPSEVTSGTITESLIEVTASRLRDGAFSLWGGWSSLKADLKCVIDCDWPGSDGVLGQLEAMGPIGAFPTKAAKGATTVIGRTKDLGNLAKGERSLLDRLKPNLGNAKDNWARNSGALREEMRRGFPIRDASPNDFDGIFLNAERALLRERGWTFNPNTNYWMPPKP